MAIHNSFFGYGQVITDPNIIKDKETGENVRGMCAIATIRGKRDAGNNLDNIRYDCPTIRTRNADQIEEISGWKKDDMVEIKGTITSREVNKKSQCSHCSHINETRGIVTFINPIYLSRREINVSHQYGISLLKHRCEISNSVTLVGMLTRDPEYYESDEGYEITQYQIAVKRKYKILEDDPNRKVDFIWVRSFGKIAKRDSQYLKKGAMVFIDGYIQTRSFERDIVCEECGETYAAAETSLEIVPYSVEYLRDSNSQDEVEKAEEMKSEKDVDDVLSKLSGGN